MELTKPNEPTTCEPDNSCPEIDSIIDSFEDIRSINEDLREWGRDYASYANELEVFIDNLELLLNEQAQEIEDLKAKLTTPTLTKEGDTAKRT